MGGHLTLDRNAQLDFVVNGETWTIDQFVFVAGSTDDGVHSDFAQSTLINNGIIYTVADSGVEFYGNNGVIQNNVGAVIKGLFGIYTEADGTNIANHGTVVGRGVGVYVYSSTNVVVNNTGAILSPSEAVLIQSGGGGTFHNSGRIAGGQWGIDVDPDIGSTTVIDNRVGGSIQGLGVAAILVEYGMISLSNAGRIIGDIVNTTSGHDIVVNLGTITGKVHLGGGNDGFNGNGGSSGPVFGEAGNDNLLGSAHADLLHGGDGNDTLTGRGGADRFFFDTALNAATNVDRITDFAPGSDKIELSATYFSGVGAPGVLAGAKFFEGAAAHDASDRIIYNPSNGYLIEDANGRTSGGVTHFATLALHLVLHNTDFIVIA